MAESESGISNLMEDMDLEDMDTGYEQDFDVEIIDGFHHQYMDADVFRLLFTT